MRVLLLNPPSIEESWYPAEHLGIAYLATVLRQAGHEVQLLDSLLEDLDVKQTFQTIMARCSQIDVLGITATEPETIRSGLAIVRLLHGAGVHAHVTVGGYLPTFWSDELLRECLEVDSVVIGEGEETLRELVETLQRGGNLEGVAGLAFRNGDCEMVHTPPRPLIHNLDRLPFPARDYLSVAYQKYHHALVYSSRGCYHRCSFCQIAQFYRLSRGRPYRTRTAKNIADEIEVLVKEHGVSSIFFVDDEFITESPKRRHIIEELIAEIHKRKLNFSFSIQYRADTGSDETLLRSLKDVGLSTVFIGVESGVEDVLERFEKGISKANIQSALQLVKEMDFSTNIGYMLFNPGTTFEELKKSIEYLVSPEAPTVLKLIGMMVLKGTPEEHRLCKQGKFSERSFRIRYPIADKRVAVFADWLRAYHPIYEPVVRDYYELHFMIGDLTPDNRQAILKSIREVEKGIRDLHQQFLSRSLASLLNLTTLAQDTPSGQDPQTCSVPASSAWIGTLKLPFKALQIQTKQLLKDGRATILTSNPQPDIRKPL